ncbi:MAG TPA: autotransporter-associated beta strand repeat-containing protein [Chloroflexota bacterium]
MLASDQIGSITGTSISDRGVLDLNGFSETLSGILTLDSSPSSGAQITTGAGTLTLGGNVGMSTTNGGGGGTSISGHLDLGGATRTFSPGGVAPVDIDISAIMSGTGAGITVNGFSGTLRFSGSASNTYTGPTTVSAGTLELAKSGSAVAVPSVLTIGGGVNAPNSAIVRELVANKIGDGVAVTVASDGLLDLNGFSDTIGSLASGGNVSLGNATLTTGGDGTSTIFSGVIGGTGGNLNKMGAGTFTLAGTLANTYTGVTTVTAGTLALNKTASVDAIAASSGLTIGGFGSPATARLLASDQIADATEVLARGGGSSTSTGSRTPLASWPCSSTRRVPGR